MTIWAGTDSENATIAFQLPGQGFTLDGFGNRLPALETVEVRAFLRLTSSAEDRSLLQVDQRTNPDSRALSGYCMGRLPDSILEETKGRLVWNGKPGDFLLVQINPPYGRSGLGAMLEGTLGTKIVGWWTPDR